MLEFSGIQCDEIERTLLLKIVPDIRKHMIDNLNPSVTDIEKFDDGISEILISIVPKGINTLSLVCDFVEISIDFKWSFFEEIFFIDIINDEKIHGYAKLILLRECTQ